jgi:hypothetical protein
VIPKEKVFLGFGIPDWARNERRGKSESSSFSGGGGGKKKGQGGDGFWGEGGMEGQVRIEGP